MPIDEQIQKGHPKGLYVLFFTEMWERFSYYGMRAIFTLYMIKALVFDKGLASTIYGSYTGLVYLTPLLGGYVADRYWGNRKSIFWGGIMMAIGQFFMFLSASFYTQTELAATLMYAGLGALIFGNGFFKPNISTMVGQLYPEGDSRIDGAYTIFYMGINIGAMFSPLVAGGLGDTGNPADFKWGFLAACIGMVVGTLIFEFYKNKYVVDANGNPIGAKPPKKMDNDPTKAVFSPMDFAKLISLFGLSFALFFYLVEFDFIGSMIFAAIIAAPFHFLTDKTINKEEKERIMAIFIMAFFVIFFWAAFEQAGASLTFFAEEQTDRFLFGWEVPASYFQSVNAAFIVIFAPIFVAIWAFLNKMKIEPSSPMKMAIGLVLLSFGYLIIAFGVKGVEPGVKVSMMWLITMYLMHTWGELALSPIGLALVNKLSPVHLSSLLMGVWFLAISAANKFAGTLSTFYPEPGNPKIFLGVGIESLYDFFMLFFFLSFASGVLLFFINSYLLKIMHGKR
jgi:POT family proton-dependent oligopeptide transporter